MCYPEVDPLWDVFVEENSRFESYLINTRRFIVEKEDTSAAIKYRIKNQQFSECDTSLIVFNYSIDANTFNLPIVEVFTEDSEIENLVNTSTSISTIRDTLDSVRAIIAKDRVLVALDPQHK